MKAWEVLKLAYEGKHEGRALECIKGMYWIKGLHISYKEDICKPIEHECMDNEWTLLPPEPKPVPISEAMVAYFKGKMIELEFDGARFTYYYKPLANRDVISFHSIKDGKWYIKEG